MHRTSLACLLVLLIAAPLARGAESFTESFTSTALLDPVGDALVDTVAGRAVMPPRPLTQIGSYGAAAAVDLVRRADTVYLAGGNGSPITAVNVLDPSSPAGPVFTYAFPAYRIDVAGDVLAAAGRGNGYLLLDLRNLGAVAAYALVPGDFVEDVALVADRLYLNLADSLRVLDIADPANPVRLGAVALNGTPGELVVHGSHAFVARGSELSVVDVSDPTSPVQVAADTAGSSFLGVSVQGDLAFASIVDTGVRCYDITDPGTPVTLSTYPTPGYVETMTPSGDELFVGARDDGVIVLDITDPSQPTPVTSFDTAGSAGRIETDDDVLYVADGGPGLVVLDVGYKGLYGSVGTFSNGYLARIEASGDHTYGVVTGDGLRVYSTADPGAPVLVTSEPLPATHDLAVSGNHVFLANDPVSGFVVVDVSDPANPAVVHFEASGYPGARFIRVEGHRLYLGSPGGSLEVYDVGVPTAPVLVGQNTYGSLTALEAEGEYAVIGQDLGGFGRVAVVRPDPVLSIIGQVLLPEPVNDLVMDGDVVYAVGDTRAYAVSIENPFAPVLNATSSGDFPASALSVCVTGRRMYVGLGNGGIEEYEANPYVLGSSVRSILVKHAADVLVLGENLQVASGNSGFALVQVLNRRYEVMPDAAVISLDVNPRPGEIVMAVRPTVATVGEVEAFARNDLTGFFDVAIPGEWYFLSPPDDNLYWAAKLYADVPGAKPALEEITLEFLFEDAQIDAVADIPGDQGGQVRITWDRSGHDRVGSSTPVLEYAIYRRIEGGAKPLPGDGPATAALLAGWDYVTSVPAETEGVYSAVVPTLADSTEAGGMAWSVFLVRARTATPGVFFDSRPDSGWSTDDLAPNVPANLAATYGTGSGNLLVWDPPVDEDFRYFRVYRGTSPGFPVAGTTPVAAVVDPSWTDPDHDGTGVFYRVTSVDFAGNESAPAEAEGPVVGIPETTVPPRLVLRGAFPNPFPASTRLVWALPEAGRVRLEVFDVRGRRVRTLVDGPRDAGEHRIAWDGRDDTGRSVPPGIYFTRLAAGDEIRTGRLVRTR